MGTEAVWVPYAIAALGAGATAYDNVNTRRKQEAASEQMSLNQQRVQKRADQTINDTLSGLEQSTADDERKAAMDGFLQQLRSNSGAAGGTSNVVNASDRFKQGNATSEAAIKNFGTTRADQLSRIVSPTRQRTNEGIDVGRANSEIGGIARDADAQRFIDQLKIQSIHNNPWLQAGGQLAMGVGSGMAASAGSGASTVPGQAGKFARVMDNPVKQVSRFAMNV